MYLNCLFRFLLFFVVIFFWMVVVMFLIGVFEVVEDMVWYLIIVQGLLVEKIVSLVEVFDVNVMYDFDLIGVVGVMVFGLKFVGFEWVVDVGGGCFY